MENIVASVEVVEQKVNAGNKSFKEETEGGTRLGRARLMFIE